MKAITRTSEDIVNDIVSDVSKKTEELSTKLDEISNKLAKPKSDEKINEIIQRMKDKIPEKVVKNSTKQESLEKHENIEKHEPEKKEFDHSHENDLDCPSCSKGHIHKIENSGLTMKCTDGNCGEEFFIIPKSADHACTNCGFPIKKSIAESKNLNGCPFCNNKMAEPFSNGRPTLKFDFSKLKK